VAAAEEEEGEAAAEEEVADETQWNTQNLFFA
jgi:hypothetical protein